MIVQRVHEFRPGIVRYICLLRVCAIFGAKCCAASVLRLRLRVPTICSQLCKPIHVRTRLLINIQKSIAFIGLRARQATEKVRLPDPIAFEAADGST